ncbi:hypothetical protein Tco_1242769 [Tanacetum coccineum]
MHGIFRSLHSYLQVLSKEDLKGTRIEHGFKRAFMSLFGQDDDTFTTFWVLNNQFQKFIDSQFSLDYDSQMTDNYFVECTGIEVKHFRDTLLQHMGNVKKSVAKRIRHQRRYDRRVNKQQMQTQKSKIDTGKAVDANLVVTESSGTESDVQDDSSRSGNDTDADDAYIIPIYDKEPMDKDNVFAIAALKNNLRKLKGNSVDTKFAKTSVLGKPVIQSLRNQSVVRQPNAFKSERPQKSKPRFSSQVDVNNNLSRLVTQHYLPKRKESAFAKPDHMIASSESRNRVNSHARFNPHRPETVNKPVDQKSHTQKPGRQIFTRHRFSPNKTSAVYEKTSPRSVLRWKPTGRIFKSVGLRWIPIGKLFNSYTSKVDSEPPHGSNVDIPNIHEYKQTLDSMVAEKADISETIVKVDSQMMIQKKDVLLQQIKPRSLMSNDV